jgi:isochorismate hydrolase
MGILWREHFAQEKAKALHLSLSMTKYFMDHKSKDAEGAEKILQNVNSENLKEILHSEEISIDGIAILK